MPTKDFCDHLLTFCFNNQSNTTQSFDGYCEVKDFLDYTLQNWIEVPIVCLILFMLSAIIMLSIFGRIDGTFKWCIMNTSILHLTWPIFYKILMEFILIKIWPNFPRPFAITNLINSALGKNLAEQDE